MTVFVDTSAILGGLNRADDLHDPATGAWKKFLSETTLLVTTNYVVVESLAVIQGRLGLPAVRAFLEEIVPNLRVEWVDEETHRAVSAALLAADRRGLSLVDLSSFETMRRLGIRSAFTFDRHFRQYGFEILP
jgi:predicted nucleic acid-binding protein